MGSSGSGKTTLLNVLNRKNCGSFKVSGSIKVNNKKMDKKFAKLSAYVQQDDLFYPTLTVKEHLKFQAALRMDKHIEHDERMSAVDKVLIDFGLKKCENTKIGGVLMQMVFKGISGGEKKRLAIASEVLTNPSVLFLDEPTSGLDSFMAESVIDSLNNLARLGRTVICTIHQPSSQLFSKFDKLMLLSNGRVAFFGSLTDAEVFFSQCGLACPRLFNPADHYIYNLAVVPGDEERSKRAISTICDCFEKSPMNKFKESLKQNEVKVTQIHGDDVPKSMYKASWCGQLKTLLHRSYLNTMRTPLVTAVRIMQSVVIALVIGLIYLGQKYDGKGIMNIDGVIFLTLTQMAFPYLFGVISTFCPELPLFLREHWNGMYRTDTYFLAKNIAEIPGIVISVLIYGTISYWMIVSTPEMALSVMATTVDTIYAICNPPNLTELMTLEDFKDMDMCPLTGKSIIKSFSFKEQLGYALVKHHIERRRCIPRTSIAAATVVKEIQMKTHTPQLLQWYKQQEENVERARSVPTEMTPRQATPV
ncbi:Protein white [Nymphon striatum]|nr:Protein white [Nymphon striatum]